MNTSNTEYWEKTFSNKEWGKYPVLELVRFIAKNFYSVKNRKDIKILELGSGPGANLWYLAREGFSVYGIDGSQTACNKAIEKLKEDRLETQLINIEVGDYFNILDKYENNYFDAIVDIESIYCNLFEKSKQIISKSFDKLKVGGKFLSITFANKEWHIEYDDIEYHATCDPSIKEYFRYTTRDDIDKLYKNEHSVIKDLQMLEMHYQNGKSKKEWIIELEKV